MAMFEDIELEIATTFDEKFRHKNCLLIIRALYSIPVVMLLNKKNELKCIYQRHHDATTTLP